MAEKEGYRTPQMDITYFESEDVITTSGIGDENDVNNPWG